MEARESIHHGTSSSTARGPGSFQLMSWGATMRSFKAVDCLVVKLFPQIPAGLIWRASGLVLMVAWMLAVQGGAAEPEAKEPISDTDLESGVADTGDTSGDPLPVGDQTSSFARPTKASASAR